LEKLTMSFFYTLISAFRRPCAVIIDKPLKIRYNTAHIRLPPSSQAKTLWMHREEQK
jgi:hypothetical protein